MQQRGGGPWNNSAYSLCAPVCRAAIVGISFSLDAILANTFVQSEGLDPQISRYRFTHSR